MSKFILVKFKDGTIDATLLGSIPFKEFVHYWLSIKTGSHVQFYDGSVYSVVSPPQFMEEINAYSDEMSGMLTLTLAPIVETTNKYPVTLDCLHIIIPG